jgi:signal recognition particle receptor subunit beta
MARYEKGSQRIIVQIVYDGPAFAGKTTNLAQLCKCFTTQRRSELFSAETAGERTLFLDWLEVQGGLIAGQQLVCRLLAVPGQAVLARRRWFLLQQADALVFILNGTTRGVEEALPMFGRARSFVEEHQIPLIVQANKQDLPGAIAPEEIARSLGLEPAQVLGARSDSGQGVKETALLVIRAVADQLKKRIAAEGLDSLTTEVLTGEGLVQAMLARERSEPMNPVEVVRRGAELAQAATAERSAPQPIPAEPIPAEPIPAEPVARSRRPKRAAAGSRKPRAKTKRTSSGVRTRGESGQDSPDAPPLPEAPPLPVADAPTGFIWPSATGRDLLRRIPLAEAVWRKDMVLPTDQANGRSSFVFEAGLWCLKTASDCCYAELSSAHQALLTTAHRKLSLGELLPKNTLLTLSTDERGKFWLWTISPWLTSVETLITHAQVRNDERALRDALVAYADAVLRTIELARTQSLRLCVSPRCFAMLGEQVFYVGDDIADGGLSPDFGRDVLERVELLPSHLEAVEAYVTHIEHELRGGFSAVDLESLGIPRLLRSIRPQTPMGREARGRWLRAANGG